MKVASTVLRGGRIERSYLSQQKVAGSYPATLTMMLFHTVKTGLPQGQCTGLWLLSYATYKHMENTPCKALEACMTICLTLNSKLAFSVQLAQPCCGQECVIQSFTHMLSAPEARYVQS